MYGETVIKHYERKFFTQTNIRQSKQLKTKATLSGTSITIPALKVKARMPVVEDRWSSSVRIPATARSADTQAG
jgi:hypothetical protein